MRLDDLVHPFVINY